MSSAVSLAPLLLHALLMVHVSVSLGTCTCQVRIIVTAPQGRWKDSGVQHSAHSERELSFKRLSEIDIQTDWWLQFGVMTDVMGGTPKTVNVAPGRTLTWLPAVSLFRQAYFFDAPEMDHLPTTTATPNQTVVTVKSS